jgi:hypothetical protein
VAARFVAGDPACFGRVEIGRPASGKRLGHSRTIPATGEPAAGATTYRAKGRITITG